MKKVILIILAAAMFLLQAPAYADTVTVVSNTSFSNPQSQIKSEGEYAFRGVSTITFEVAGNTCNLNGSLRGSVPSGCNYLIEVAPNGQISGELTAGNYVCTQSADIPSSCG